jgi:hypothetical protein
MTKTFNARSIAEWKRIRLRPTYSRPRNARLVLVRPARRQTASDDAREASPPAAFLAQSVESCVEGIQRMILHRRLEASIGDQPV